MVASIFKSLMSLCLVGLLGCGKKQQESDLFLTKAQYTSEFPEVVFLDILQSKHDVKCTGTFVSPRVVLTAAHCFDARKENIVELSGIRSSDYFIHEDLDILLPGFITNKAYDLALVRFSQDMSQSFLKVASAQAEPGDAVTLVGFGSTSILKQVGVGTKRTGRSVVTQREKGFYEIAGNIGEENGESTKADGSKPDQMRFSAIGEGDSGGPLLDQSGQKILGVVSSTGLSTDFEGLAVSYFADLLDPMNRSFLEKLVEVIDTKN